MLMDLRTQLAANLHRRIAAAGIHHDDLVRPFHRFQAGADIFSFIFGDDDDGEFSHAFDPL